MLLFNFSSNFFFSFDIESLMYSVCCSVLFFFFFWASIQFFLVGPRFRGPNLAGLNGACGARHGRVRAGKKIRLVNFQIFPKIFPTLNFIYFLFFSLPLFPAQILLYISCFFITERLENETKDKGARYWFIPPVLFFAALIYLSLCIPNFIFLFSISRFAQSFRSTLTLNKLMLQG